MSKKDYYKILGVSKDSSIDEIKKAYKKIAKKSHPDIDKKSDYTEFLSLQEAYFVLSDHTRRKQYDKELEEKHIDINQYNGFDDFFVICYPETASGHETTSGLLTHPMFA